MKAILAILLIALVSSTTTGSFNFQQFLSCLKTGLYKDENLPAALRALNTAINTKSFDPLSKFIKEKIPTAVNLVHTCFDSSFEEEVQLKNVFTIKRKDE